MLAPATLLVLLVASVSLSKGLTEEECKKPPPNWPQKPPRCCGDLPFPTENMKQVFGTCVDALPKDPPAAAGRAAEDPTLCLDECVYKGVGFWKGKGDALEKETISRALTQNVPAPWTAAVKNAATACANKKVSRAVGTTCSPGPHDHTHCVLRQLFLNCPKELWIESPECTIIRKRMEECPGLPPPPPQLPEQNFPQESQRTPA